MASEGYVVYGAPGSGSVAVEAALTLIGAPWRVVDADWNDFDPVERVNPLRQVPALALPSGELMTESAAILLHLAEAHPEAELAPPAADSLRPAFLRWMIYVPAAIYPMYWVRDVPSRLAADGQAEAVILQRTAARIAECWGKMNAQVSPGDYILGDRLTMLDLYVAVVSRWTPGRLRFGEVAPKLAGPVRRVDDDPRLAELWAQRFPPGDLA
ncbi:glutathione S-transferase family protein [Phenylobacterium sp.]|uniref:glutathione S-transferase family protein n=1 Tax=Phenylobacterium sp. TaxID=1871053 RepID=UPI002FDA273C